MDRLKIESSPVTLVDKVEEKRVRPVGAALELGVELGGDEVRVSGQLDHLYQVPVG